ncbi:MAG TPA: dihydrodipicolinate synthase family protein [Chitinophagaceae bacterium]|nr:dihydrodipicolinate synthase family protein [Chitinophagaceae bacterium]
MSFQWKGVFPALLTPFTADDKLDLPLFEKNLDAQLNAGVEGIILGGTLGESSVLTTEEKAILVKVATAKVANKIPVILNIAEGSTREALIQVHNARLWGARGLMMLPPMRYKPDHRECVEYFKTIANNTDLPIMIYNNPVDYKTEITLAMFEELVECKNIQAVKESTRDVSNVTRMINRFGNRIKILCGVDTLAMEELCMGADGWVAGLVDAFPSETVMIYKLVKSGKIEDAAKIYRWFLPLLELDIHPKLVQYIKLAASQTGLGSEYVRAPRLPLIGEERENILKIIKNGIKTRPAL